MSVEDNILAVLEMTDSSKETQAIKLESFWMNLVYHIRKTRGDLLSGGEMEEQKLHALWLPTPSLFF